MQLDTSKIHTHDVSETDRETSDKTKKIVHSLFTYLPTTNRQSGRQSNYQLTILRTYSYHHHDRILVCLSVVYAFKLPAIAQFLESQLIFLSHRFDTLDCCAARDTIL